MFTKNNNEIIAMQRVFHLLSGAKTTRLFKYKNIIDFTFNENPGLWSLVIIFPPPYDHGRKGD